MHKIPLSNPDEHRGANSTFFFSLQDEWHKYILEQLIIVISSNIGLVAIL